MKPEKKEQKKGLNRRNFIKNSLTIAGAVALTACISKGELDQFLHKHFRTLSKKEKDELITRLKKEYAETYGKEFSVSAAGPIPGTFFGYGLDISRCIGCRRCVYACAEENNLSRVPQVHWIQVLEMEKEKGIDFIHANLYYEHDKVPYEGHFYLPVSCQQCKNPPCVKTCPVKATWSEADGIVVVDYNWCIGCRCCMAACPYGARHFNWKKPSIPAEDINTEVHVLGNRPQFQGIVTKCTFCIQRVRKGLYPKCVEVCPVGARKFGNLLDEKSEIRYILKNKRVLILKEELNTQPKFFYFFGS